MTIHREKYPSYTSCQGMPAERLYLVHRGRLLLVSRRAEAAARRPVAAVEAMEKLVSDDEETKKKGYRKPLSEVGGGEAVGEEGLMHPVMFFTWAFRCYFTSLLNFSLSFASPC